MEPKEAKDRRDDLYSLFVRKKFASPIQAVIRNSLSSHGELLSSFEHVNRILIRVSIRIYKAPVEELLNPNNWWRGMLSRFAILQVDRYTERKKRNNPQVLKKQLLEYDEIREDPSGRSDDVDFLKYLNRGIERLPIHQRLAFLYRESGKSWGLIKTNLRLESTEKARKLYNSAWKSILIYLRDKGFDI